MGLLVLFAQVLSMSVGADLCSQLYIGGVYVFVYVPTGNTFSALLVVGREGRELSGYEIPPPPPLTKETQKLNTTM